MLGPITAKEGIGRTSVFRFLKLFEVDRRGIAINDTQHFDGTFAGHLFRTFFVEIVGSTYFFAIYEYANLEFVAFVGLIAGQYAVVDGIAILLAPFEELALVIVVVLFQFVNIEVFAQDLAHHELSGVFITHFDIDGPHERFEGVAEHGLGEFSLVIGGQVHVEAHFIADFVERVALHDFGAHFGQKAFIAIGVFFEQILAHDGAQYGIAKEFQPFVIGDGIIAIAKRAFMVKSQFEQIQIDGRKAQQVMQSARQFAVLMEVVII